MHWRVGAAALLVSLSWLMSGLVMAQSGGQVPAPVASTASSTAWRSLRVSETEGAVHITVPGDSLWEIAGAAIGNSNVDRNQAMVAIVRRNPEAFPEGNLNRIQRGLSLVIPPLPEMRAEDLPRAVALVEQHRQAHANRALVPMPLYPLSGAPGASSAPSAAVVVPGSADTDRAAVAPVPAPVAEAASSAPAPPSGVPWLPLGVMAVLGAVAVGVLVRRSGAREDEADRAAEAELASRAFADSRLQLASQLEEELESRQLAGAGDEPLYAALDDPTDLAEAAPVVPLPRAVGPLVWRPGQGLQPAVPAAAANDEAPPQASGEALALALTLAHAYADVGRPDTARRWLQAIDDRGAAPR